jgi:hypothetical protein
MARWFKAMAGERQHFLPRFLLKGFASRTARQQYYTWVFQKGKPPFESNILNIGLAKNFYTHRDDIDADATITAQEEILSNHVQDLRRCPSHTPVDSVKSAALVTNIVLRTKSLRQAFQDPTEYFLHSLLRTLAVPGVMQNLLKNYARTHSKKLMGELLASREEFSALTNREKEVLQDLAVRMIPEMVDKHSETLSSQLGPLFDTLLQNLNARLPYMIKESHIKALMIGNATSIREAAMQNLNWFVFVTQGEKFILGDVGPICKNSGTNRHLLLASPEDTDEIFCPISDTCLLVGTKEKLPPIDLHEINSASASCSGQFFVSSSNSVQSKHYREILSSHAQLISEQDLDAIVADIVEGH